MTKLAPYYGKLINEQLEERMNEWLKMQPGETLEQYQARVNAESREAQRKLFEAEIAAWKLRPFQRCARRGVRQHADNLPQCA